MILKIQAAARGRAARRSVECIRRGDDPDSWRKTRNAPRPPRPRPPRGLSRPRRREALDVAGLTPGGEGGGGQDAGERAGFAPPGRGAGRRAGRDVASGGGGGGEDSGERQAHLARSDAVAAALDESASVKVDAVALNDASRMLQATARAHLEMRAAAVDASPDAPPRGGRRLPAVVDTSSAVVDADVNLDVAALDPDSKDKVVTMQASARAHVERVRSAADASKDSAKPTVGSRGATEPTRVPPRRRLMRRDSFKRLELEGVSVARRGCAGGDSPGAATAGSFSADDHPVPVTMSSRARRLRSDAAAPDVGSSPAAFQDAGATYTEEDEVHIVKIQAATRGHLARIRGRLPRRRRRQRLRRRRFRRRTAPARRGARRRRCARRGREQEAAAVKIQAVHRGRAARKQISAQREGGPVQ